MNIVPMENNYGLWKFTFIRFVRKSCLPRYGNLRFDIFVFLLIWFFQFKGRKNSIPLQQLLANDLALLNGANLLSDYDEKKPVEGDSQFLGPNQNGTGGAGTEHQNQQNGGGGGVNIPSDITEDEEEEEEEGEDGENNNNDKQNQKVAEQHNNNHQHKKVQSGARILNGQKDIKKR